MKSRGIAINAAAFMSLGRRPPHPTIPAAERPLQSRSLCVDRISASAPVASIRYPPPSSPSPSYALNLKRTGDHLIHAPIFHPHSRYLCSGLHHREVGSCHPSIRTGHFRLGSRCCGMLLALVLAILGIPMHPTICLGAGCCC